MTGIIRIGTENMSHEVWLEERRKGLGGSDAAAVVGLNAYTSPYALWADKTGRLPPREDNEAMRQGRDLEGYVASRWEEATGKKARRVNAILRNPDIPFAHANIDRMVVGEHAGLELKTTSVLNLKKFRNGEYPPNYYCQCCHYMMVTGAERWYLGVLVLNQGFYEYVIDRDEDEIKALRDAEEAFWSLVESDTPPPVDGSGATTEALQAIFTDDNGEGVELFGMDGRLAQWFALVRQEKEIERQKEEIKQELMKTMGEAQRGYGGIGLVDWSSRSRRSLDVGALKEAMPDIDLEPYYKTTCFRTFQIKEEKA